MVDGDPSGQGTAAPRLSDAAVRDRLTRLDGLLEQVEQLPGPSGELALAAVSALATVYGEALARVVAHAAADASVLAAIVGDELLGHLLVLHDAHPDPVQVRVTRAIDRLRPAVQSRGGEVELVGIEQDTSGGKTAVIRLRVGGCATSAASIEDAVREAVLAAAPELSAIRWAATPQQAAFVPVAALLPRPAGMRP